MIICSISLLGNFVLGALVFAQGHITKRDDRYGSYSGVVPYLKMALEYGDKAEEAKEVSTHLALVNEQLSLVKGVLIGLKGDASARGIDFNPLIGALWARLGFPEVHAGGYTSQELNSIKIADDRLRRLVEDLEGTEFSTAGMRHLRQAIDHVNSYVTTWGY